MIMKKNFFKGNFFLRFLCVLVCTLACASEAWATNYWKIRVVALNPEGGEGRVFTRSYYVSETTTWYADYTKSMSRDDGGLPDVKLYAQAASNAEAKSMPCHRCSLL